MTTTLQDYSQAAIARAEARHAAADSLQYNIAGFSWNGSAYVVTVRDSIVARFRTLSEVKAFSEMHNGRLMGGAS